MEIWKTLTDFPSYEISTFGSIRRILGRDKKPIIPRILKQSTDSWGYKQICLSENGRQSTKKIHSLIMLTFSKKPSEFHTIDHIDRNKSNNNLDNLRWATMTEQRVNTEKQENNNIYRTKQNTYRVIIRRNKTCICWKTLKSLQEAIDYRNDFLNNLIE